MSGSYALLGSLNWAGHYSWRPTVTEAAREQVTEPGVMLAIARGAGETDEINPTSKVVTPRAGICPTAFAT